jgi:hypothetical protein
LPADFNQSGYSKSPFRDLGFFIVNGRYHLEIIEERKKKVARLSLKTCAAFA